MSVKRAPWFILMLLFATGIFLSCRFDVSLGSLGPAWLACALLLCVRRVAVVALALMVVLTGALYGFTRAHQGVIHMEKQRAQYLVDRVRGTIISDVEQREFRGVPKTVFTLDVTQAHYPWGWREGEGKLKVQVFQPVDAQFGDRLEMEGKLHRPFDYGQEENFSYTGYLKNYFIHSMFSVKKTGEVMLLEEESGISLRKWAYALRDFLREHLHGQLTPNEAGIMQAVLLGDRSQVPKPVRELFVRTGTAHILAISGLHVGIAAGLFWMVIRLLPLPRRVHIGLTVVCLIFYALLTGLRPSILRAMIMTCVFLLAYICERESKTVNSLSFAACVVLVINPLYLNDVGFQLSFACLFSICTADAFIKLWERRCERKVTRAARFVLISAAIWIGAGGISMYYFQVFVFVTVLANIFIIPLITIVVGLGFGLLASMGWTFLTGMFAVCVKLALNVMVAVIFLLAQIPGAYVFLADVTLLHVLIYYLGLGTLAASGWWALSRGQKGI